MDGLAPPLELCVGLRLEIESGKSIFRAVKNVIRNQSNEMCADLGRLLARHERGELGSLGHDVEARLYRKALLQIIMVGLRGEPVLAQLRELEVELMKACQADVDRFAATLPMKTMVPLLLIQFPAFLLVMLGPVVSELVRGFNR
jgi:hypothetical protein